MTIINNGTLTFSKALTEEQEEKLLEIFGKPAYFNDGALVFEEYRRSDLAPEINKAISLCEEWGVDIEDGTITYFGDCDGFYAIRNGIAEEVSCCDDSIQNATDAELQSEVARRKGEHLFAFADGKTVSLKPTEIEEVFRFQLRENRKKDAVLALDDYLEDENTQDKERFEKICLKVIGIEKPGRNILLNSYIISRMADIFEDNACLSIAANETWATVIQQVFEELA